MVTLDLRVSGWTGRMIIRCGIAIFLNPWWITLSAQNCGQNKFLSMLCPGIALRYQIQPKLAFKMHRQCCIIKSKIMRRNVDDILWMQPRVCLLKCNVNFALFQAVGYAFFSMWIHDSSDVFTGSTIALHSWER